MRASSPGGSFVAPSEMYQIWDYFLRQIRADIHSNCLTNGPNAFSFPESSQVLKEVLLPFFVKKYSEHVLIGSFHGEEDGSWILAGQQCSKS